MPLCVALSPPTTFPGMLGMEETASSRSTLGGTYQITKSPAPRRCQSCGEVTPAASSAAASSMVRDVPGAGRAGGPVPATRGASTKRNLPGCFTALTSSPNPKPLLVPAYCRVSPSHCPATSSDPFWAARDATLSSRSGSFSPAARSWATMVATADIEPTPFSEPTNSNGSVGGSN